MIENHRNYTNYVKNKPGNRKNQISQQKKLINDNNERSDDLAALEILNSYLIND